MVSFIYEVRQGHCVVIERFGSFARVQQSGLAFRIPWIEKVRRVDIEGSDWGDSTNKGGWQIELSDQQTNTPARACQTRDNVEVTADAAITWRIIDVRRAVYDVDNLPEQLADRALNALRSRIGTLDLDTVLAQRAELSRMVLADLSNTAQAWGISYKAVEIQEIKVAEETLRAMRLQMEAERQRRAVVAEAEGRAAAEIRLAEAHRDAVVLRAQGEAQAYALRAEAEARFLARLQKVTTPENAAKILLSQKYIEGFDTISKKDGDKIYLPNNFMGLFGLGDN